MAVLRTFTEIKLGNAQRDTIAWRAAVRIFYCKYRSRRGSRIVFGSVCKVIAIYLKNGGTDFWTVFSATLFFRYLNHASAIVEFSQSPLEDCNVNIPLRKIRGIPQVSLSQRNDKNAGLLTPQVMARQLLLLQQPLLDLTEELPFHKVKYLSAAGKLEASLGPIADNTLVRALQTTLPIGDLNAT